MLVRSVRPADKAAVGAMFARLSADTRCLRFHHCKPRLSADEVDCFCEVDQEDHLALVAELPRRGRPAVVGTGRLDRLPHSDSGEVSFIVEDAEQGRGIGTALLECLAGLARERGITTLVAELLYQNTVMMHVFRRYDPDLVVVVDTHCYRVTFSAREGQTEGGGRGWEET